MGEVLRGIVTRDCRRITGAGVYAARSPSNNNASDDGVLLIQFIINRLRQRDSHEPQKHMSTDNKHAKGLNLH